VEQIIPVSYIVNVVWLNVVFVARRPNGIVGSCFFKPCSLNDINILWTYHKLAKIAVNDVALL